MCWLVLHREVILEPRSITPLMPVSIRRQTAKTASFLSIYIPSSSDWHCFFSGEMHLLTFHSCKNKDTCHMPHWFCNRGEMESNVCRIQVHLELFLKLMLQANVSLLSQLEVCSFNDIVSDREKWKTAVSPFTYKTNAGLKLTHWFCFCMKWSQ